MSDRRVSYNMDEIRTLVFRVEPSNEQEPLSARDVLASFKVAPVGNFPSSRHENKIDLQGTGVYKFVGQDGEQYFRVSPSDNLEDRDVVRAVSRLCDSLGLEVSRIPGLPAIDVSLEQRIMDQYLPEL